MERTMSESVYDRVNDYGSVKITLANKFVSHRGTENTEIVASLNRPGSQRLM